MLELIELKNYDALAFFIMVRVTIICVCWAFMVLSSVIDFWTGVATAKALGEKLMSHGFRRTIVKVGDYARLMLFALMFDALGSLLPVYILPFATILCTMAVMCIEGKSVVENSRRKKTHAADVPDMVRQIVEAATHEQGNAVLRMISEQLANNEKKERYQHEEN